MKERIHIFIDGSNLYHRLTELEITKLTRFDYSEFSQWLAHGRELVSQRYYVGVIRAQQNDTKAQNMRRYQQRLLSRLEKETWHISRGFLMQTDGRYHEKGVDVKIATDLLVGAYENSYDTAIIVSSDTDMIPAIQKVRELGKHIEYIGFSHKPSFAMQKHASLSRLVIREELEPFAHHDIVSD